MKKLYIFNLILAIFTLQPLFAITSKIPTVKEQLENLNKFWQDKNFDDKILNERILLKDEVQLIQMHLSLVEQKLRDKKTDHLSTEQKANRLKCLDILNQYWTKGVFPQNIYHAKRTPYFIDHLGTACAVGQLIIETGYKDFAIKISTENNYGYIKELNEKYPEVKQWADKFGFTVSELAWIQPTYGICNIACNQHVQIGFQNSSWGTPPYTYLWNPTGQTTSTATGLCPGTTYTCTFIDSRGDTVPKDLPTIVFQTGLYMGNVISIPAATPYTFSKTFTKCAGQSVTVGTHTYTVTGTYKDTLRGSASNNTCDTIVTTHLTILPKKYFSQAFTKCAGQSVTVGTHTYTVSGTYHDTLTAFNSCDSIITTNLTVLPANTFSQTITKCIGQSLTVGTNTYTISGTYQDTLTTANTCDSIVITHLTVSTDTNCTTGIVQNNTEADISIFPNPTTGELYIVFKQQITGGSIQIKDITGQTILEKNNLTGKQFTFNIESNTTGIYFIELTQSGVITRKKLFKQ